MGAGSTRKPIVIADGRVYDEFGLSWSLDSREGKRLLATTEGQQLLEKTLPPSPPDLADEVIRAAQRAERDRLRVGHSRASSFRSLLGG